MKIFDKTFTVKFLYVILLFFVVILLALWNEYFNGTYTLEKKETILSGLITGLIVALFQLLMSWYEYHEIARFKRMKVQDIKTHRDDREFYHNLIMKAKNNIDIMGVTANRFVNDFADINSQRADSIILFSAMDKGVVVRILIPEEQYLADTNQKDIAKHTKAKFEAIKNKNNRFNYKYFSHQATHSIFVVDNVCILGPVFPDISSKDTPAIQIAKDSPYADKYLKYFENEWASAK